MVGMKGVSQGLKIGIACDQRSEGHREDNRMAAPSFIEWLDDPVRIGACGLKKPGDRLRVDLGLVDQGKNDMGCPVAPARPLQGGFDGGKHAGCGFEVEDAVGRRDPDSVEFGNQGSVVRSTDHPHLAGQPAVE